MIQLQLNQRTKFHLQNQQIPLQFQIDMPKQQQHQSQLNDKKSKENVNLIFLKYILIKQIKNSYYLKKMDDPAPFFSQFGLKYDEQK